MSGAPRSGLRQRGAALVVTVLLFAMIGVTALLAVARGTETDAEKERRTSEALATAKEALIGFAAGVAFTAPLFPERPGDLPCPDLDNDGSADPPCSTDASRLGRLPWKTLGLPDLRDGDGERLWYAVATGFKNNPRTPCANPADATCLNSETLGTITVRNAAGVIVHDGSNTDRITNNGIIAVVIAAGAALQRQGAGASQDRSCFVAGVWQCDALSKCLPAPSPTDVPRCNPANYLDVLSGIEDNADFGDGTANGFIFGPAPTGTDAVVNDRLVAVARGDLLPVVERRVASEVALCLKAYALANGQKFPWAADMTESATLNNYLDSGAFSQRRYGRIPDPPFSRTRADDAAMGDVWVGACSLPVGTWWSNWKLQVLYSIAPGFEPGSAAACGSCLSVNRPGGGPLTNVRMVVMAAGRTLVTQTRAALGDRANPANYVEFENATAVAAPDPTFEIRAISATFNDRLAYSP